jgi:hypothetical protein
VVVCRKKQKHCLPEELKVGDCWIALSLAQLNGLILAGRVGKHTDELAVELVLSTLELDGHARWKCGAARLNKVS